MDQADDGRRFAFFSKAAFLKSLPALDFKLDIVNISDIALLFTYQNVLKESVWSRIL